MSGLKRHLDRRHWGSETRHWSATAFIEATLAVPTEIPLENLMTFQRLGAIFNHPFAAAMDTLHNLTLFFISILAITLQEDSAEQPSSTRSVAGSSPAWPVELKNISVRDQRW